MAEKRRKKKVVAQAEAPKQFTVEWVEIDSVKIWEDNPRFNDEASVELAEIIRSHGIKSPIVCWDKNRTIYKGNTTWKACKLLGYEKVPVVFHSFPSEVAAKAYGIADNKASELAGWDDDLLTNIMSQKEFIKADYNIGFTERSTEIIDHWPPSEERKEKAKVAGKKLVSRFILEVEAEYYQEVKNSLTIWVDGREGVSLR